MPRIRPGGNDSKDIGGNMELLIQTLFPVVGHAPLNGQDSNERTYTDWGLNDEAAFDIVIPANYVSGENIVLVFTEASPNIGRGHKWRVTSSVSTFNEIHDFSFVSDARAWTISSRGMVISIAGTIESYALHAGDVVGIDIKRIAADSLEDSASIRVYTVSCNIVTAEGPITAGLGRVGVIAQQVLSLFNDNQQRFIKDTDILMWINDCQSDVATLGYWNKFTVLDMVANQGSYNLLELIPDLESINDVEWTAAGSESKMYYKRLVPIGSWSAFRGILLRSPRGERPFGYHYESGLLYLAPVPQADLSQALSIQHSYNPPDLGLQTNYTPHTPLAHDCIYVKYCLMKFYQRDRHSPMALQQAAYYQKQYEEELDNIIPTGETPNIRLRSYR